MRGISSRTHRGSDRRHRQSGDHFCGDRSAAPQGHRLQQMSEDPRHSVQVGYQVYCKKKMTPQIFNLLGRRILFSSFEKEEKKCAQISPFFKKATPLLFRSL